jgi:hypothetical protein
VLRSIWLTEERGRQLGENEKLSEPQTQLELLLFKVSAVQQRLNEERGRQLGEKGKQLSELQTQLAAVRLKSCEAVQQ